MRDAVVDDYVPDAQRPVGILVVPDEAARASVEDRVDVLDAAVLDLSGEGGLERVAVLVICRIDDATVADDGCSQ